jgi:hypothetical protein
MEPEQWFCEPQGTEKTPKKMFFEPKIFLTGNWQAVSDAYKQLMNWKHAAKSLPSQFRSLSLIGATLLFLVEVPKSFPT